MKFDVPAREDFHPLYIAGNAQLSYQHSAIGLYVSHLEPFFVKSLRRVIDSIRDDGLREEADRFCRQEAQHYQRHVDFNKVVLAHGYPGLQERVDRLKQDFDGFLAHESDKFRMGYIEGFESFTTQLGLHVLGGGLYEHKRTSNAFGQLFKWHMLEEVEHRNVAFDVYQHFYDDKLHRVRMCWFAQRHMFKFFSDCERLMSEADIPRHGPRCRIRLKHRLLSGIVTTRMRLNTTLPWYTPHAYHIPANIEALSMRFTEMAQHVR
jgi:predicted metal-dependent hydrolase